MIDGQTITIIIALVTMAAGGVWKLSRVEAALRADIAASHEVIEVKQQQHSREFGETIAAIRQKVADVELWVRDHCVQITSFDRVQASLETSIRNLGAELKADLRRMEEKIDSKT